MKPQNEGTVSLARTLGLGSIILLGIGALLGGGIHTLLGPAAGLAGPGLFLAMLLGGIISFLNLQMYTALGTTFPEAGGGYLWVRIGLGNFQGFLAGWFSWFAHATAAGLYGLSFGHYIYETLRVVSSYTGQPILFSYNAVIKIAASVTILIFGYINWKGVRQSGKIGNYITVALIINLALFVMFGILQMFKVPIAVAANFTPLLPNGWFGILAAASFFYIAFEGSEIQVQTGEETKDPGRSLKKGLLYSWAIVLILYILISIVIFGATKNPSGSIWTTLANWGPSAIVESAETFMPFGRIIMIIGGLLANLAALNATIYSSSRVAYALARDKMIWSRVAEIHLKNLTPHLAVVMSTLLMMVMVVALPLFDVGSAASLLFVLLFLQLNIAGVNIHYKYPNIKWFYKIPFFPITPIVTTVLYILLALTMLSVNLNAWGITILWALLGLVNYFAYAEPKSRARFENKIVYEGSVRIGPKIGKRLLLPISPDLSDDEIKNLAELSFAIASQFDGEVLAVRVHEIPQAFALDPSVLTNSELDKERQLFSWLQELADEFNRKTGPTVKDINFHGLILIGRDIVDVLIDVIKIEECDALLLHWQGFTSTKGVRFGPIIDRLLREAKCDIIVTKNPRSIKTLMLSVDPSGKSPFANLIGQVVKALQNYYRPKMRLLSVLPKDTPSYLKPDFSVPLKELKLKKKDFESLEAVNSSSVVKTVLDEGKKHAIDMLIIGASQSKFLREIRFGTTSELIAKYSRFGVIIVKGHEGAGEMVWKKIFGIFKKQEATAISEHS